MSIVALEYDWVWYRCHHLFADFLRNHLEREQPERLVPLRLKASERYEDNELAAEVV